MKPASGPDCRRVTEVRSGLVVEGASPSPTDECQLPFYRYPRGGQFRGPGCRVQCVTNLALRILPRAAAIIPFKRAAQVCSNSTMAVEPSLSHGRWFPNTRGAPSPRGEGDTDLEADRKLAHDTLPSRVDARAPMAYAVRNAIGTNADAMDGDYLAQQRHMRAA